jgi:hypothetical protein
MEIPNRIRLQLKKPLGRLQKDFGGIKELASGHRIISIGDVCTLGLLSIGVRPHLAVFDYRFMRNRLDSGMIRILQVHFRKPKRYRNPAGTLSWRLLRDAKALLREGGAILIEGEEDLTALAFIKNAGKKDVIIYGQPDAGIVIVKEDRKLKGKIERWLSASSAALGHEVKRDKSE